MIAGLPASIQSDELRKSSYRNDLEPCLSLKWLEILIARDHAIDPSSYRAIEELLVRGIPNFRGMVRAFAINEFNMKLYELQPLFHLPG